MLTLFKTDKCVFCSIEPSEIFFESNHSFVIKSLYPSSPGHLLSIPKRHVTRLGQLDREEYSDLFLVFLNLLGSDEKSYSLGVNDGKFAGQTIQHTHLHMIPRVEGDVEDPRGGIRWVLPQTADYWNQN